MLTVTPKEKKVWRVILIVFLYSYIFLPKSLKYYTTYKRKLKTDRITNERLSIYKKRVNRHLASFIQPTLSFSSRLGEPFPSKVGHASLLYL